MSIKTYLKGAAVALPLMLGGGKAAAQTTEVIAKDTARVVAADTLKAMEQKAVDAKTFVLGKTKPHFEFSASGISGQNLPAGGATASMAADLGLNRISGKAIAASSKKESVFIGDAAYTRSFPIADGLNATGTVGLEGGIHKAVRGDSYGQLAPHATAGLAYNHQFHSGARIAAKADVGAGQPINFKREHVKRVAPVQALVNAEVEAGYKNISGFVNGGRDALVGNNIAGGVRINF